MANIIKKEDESVTFDPMRTLREWMRWDPFREMSPLLGRFETQAWMPSFEVSESKEGYMFKADLPGVKAEDIEIRLSGNRLEFHGKRESETERKGDTFYTCERSYGAFSRAFTLPDGTDTEHIKTDLKDGVLSVVVPKKPEAQARKITVAPQAPKS